jgi:hypothetical protein
LQKKAVESELDENCLIPKTDEKDKKIFEYLNQQMNSSRPASAVTGTTSASKVSNAMTREYDPFSLDNPMR